MENILREKKTELDFFPTCSKETWKKRQELLGRVRRFFEQRSVLEVETPVLSHACGTDPNLDYFKTQGAQTRYLMTSPEFHLKRLLASGFGDVYAIARSFREDETGERHNPEFTMIEWYRVGMSMENLMTEVEELCSEILNLRVTARRTRYAEAFMEYAGIDPFDENFSNWKSCCEKHGIPLFECKEFVLEEWRDYVMACIIEPKLDMKNGEFIYDYPASQAALAQVHTGADGKNYADRFELYLGGMELCNGYHELTDFKEQAKRFQEDLNLRKQMNKDLPLEDLRFLAALEHGMPECSGVALGFDRLAMLALGKQDIREVILFPGDLA